MNENTVNEKLTDEAYARAALTYLAEPADRWLARLIRVSSAAGALDTIKNYSAPGGGSPAEAKMYG